MAAAIPRLFVIWRGGRWRADWWSVLRRLLPPVAVQLRGAALQWLGAWAGAVPIGHFMFFAAERDGRSYCQVVRMAHRQASRCRICYTRHLGGRCATVGQLDSLQIVINSPFQRRALYVGHWRRFLFLSELAGRGKCGLPNLGRMDSAANDC